MVAKTGSGLKLEATQAFMRDKLVDFPDAQVHIASSPVMYGLAIYTVLMARYDEKQKRLLVFRMPEHWTRLQQSAQIMDFQDFLTAWDYSRFETTIEQLLQANPAEQDVLIRVTVFVDELLAGTRMRGLRNSLCMFVYPYTPLLNPEGAHLCVSSWQRTADAAIPARAKVNGSYVNSSLMKNEALINGYDDAISLDERGHVCESSAANIFMVREGRLMTPDNASSLLEGITRRSVIEVAEKLGIPVEARSTDRSELYVADEIFLCGSTARLTPVLSVDRRPVGNGEAGPVTAQLRSAMDAITLGHNNDFSNWITPHPSLRPASTKLQ